MTTLLIRRFGRGAATIAVAVVAICAAGPFAATAADTELSLYEKTLVSKGIEPTAESLREYLEDLHPSDEQRNRATELIGLLGSDRFADRETASRQLLIMPALPVDQLAAAAAAGDPEIRWRAKVILNNGRAQSAATLYAAFVTIRKKKLAGTAPALLQAIPLCDKRHLETAAREAIEAVALEDEADVYRQQLKSKVPEVRGAALAALKVALEEDAAADYQAVLDNTDEADSVRLVAAVAVVDYGGRRSLRELLKLLSSEDVYVRVNSSLALQKLTGQWFGFAAYDKPESRAKVVKRWEEWIAANGETAELKFPLKLADSQTSFLNGNTLLAYGYKNKVVERDPEGKELWSHTANGAWSAEKLASGNVLIAAYNENRVIEVNPDGKVVWEHGVQNPLNVRPLRNGNILVSVYAQRKVQELDREKNVVWEFTAPGNTADAHRLDNGNTLIAAMNTVIEVTPDNKVEWEYPGGQVYGIQPLNNGNVLIADLSGKVVEVNRDKEVVWEFAEPNAVDAFRLPNGNTLITSGTRFLEVSPAKEIVWKEDGCNYGSARR